jgi:hypothetical protein
MLIGAILKKMFPGATIGDYEIVNGEIILWNLADPQPTKEELETYWAQHEQEIMQEQQPKPTELDLLKTKQELMQQALDDLILGGAI